MKQVTIKAKATIVVIDLPIGAFNIKYEHDRVCFDTKDADGVIYPDYRIIPKGNYRHAGHPSKLTEEDWNGIVDQSLHTGIFAHYAEGLEKPNIFCYKNATESGLSLLRANGVVLENNIPPFKERLQDWQQAQEQVWLNPQIFVKV